MSEKTTVTIMKHEWHQVDSQYTYELDADTLSEIYPDKTEQEIEQLLAEVKSGEADVESIIDDAYENDVELDWDHDYDDWWTARKGGYDVTYDIKE